MAQEKDPLPSDAEDASLKSKAPADRKPLAPSPDDPKAEEDPSEQPS